MIERARSRGGNNDDALGSSASAHLMDDDHFLAQFGIMSLFSYFFWFLRCPQSTSSLQNDRFHHTTTASAFSTRLLAVPTPLMPRSWFLPSQGFRASPSTCFPTKYTISPPRMQTNAIGYIQCTRRPNTWIPITTPQKLLVSRLMLKKAADDIRYRRGVSE